MHRGFEGSECSEGATLGDEEALALGLPKMEDHGAVSSIRVRR
jgi:hypothetical protein